MTVRIPTQSFDTTSLYRQTFHLLFPLLTYDGLTPVRNSSLTITLEGYAPTVEYFLPLQADLDKLLPKPCLVTTVEGSTIPIEMFGEILKVDSLQQHDLIEDFGNLIKQEVLVNHPSVQIDSFKITIE